MSELTAVFTASENLWGDSSVYLSGHHIATYTCSPERALERFAEHLELLVQRLQHEGIDDD